MDDSSYIMIQKIMKLKGGVKKYPQFVKAN